MNNPYLVIILIATTVLLMGYIFWLKKKHSITINNLQRKQNNNFKQSAQENIQKHDRQAMVARKRYLSGVSHELRTPLNVIMGYAQILEKQALEGDPNQEKYTLIRHNCEHLNHLIEGILEFSAIEAGKLKVQFEVIELRDLINQVTAMFKHQAEQKGLTFSSHVDDRLPTTVKSDYKRLQQILLNLLNNAIKFTDFGTVNFNISYRNQVATFTVKDSGRGIKHSDLERIFEPFERIEHKDKPIEGTGLGLPITRLLVELMGGELTVNSKIGEGSEFIVKMMLAPLADHDPINNTLQLNETKNLNNILCRQKHILVVDDEQSHRQLITDILQQHEFQMSTAADAKEAKKLNASAEISLAIIDVAMPGINGWQLAQWLKENTPDTKIMMLSANPRDAQSSSVQAHDAYLTKPVKINQLLNEINRLLILGWEKVNVSDTITRPASMIKLSTEHRDALANMLEIGHIKGIETYLQKLATAKLISEHQYAQLLKPLNDMNLHSFKLIINHE